MGSRCHGKQVRRGWMERAFVLTAVCAGSAWMAPEALAAPVSVPEAGFETTATWTLTGAGGINASAAGGTAAEGTQVLLTVSENTDAHKVLSTTIEANTTYTLTVAHMAAPGTTGGAAIELYAWNGVSETRLGGAANISGVDTWNDLQVQVDADELAGHEGEALGIRLYGGSLASRWYDNVRLDASPSAASSYQAATSVTVPDPGFDLGSGGIDNSLYATTGTPWTGTGWLAQVGTNGIFVASHSAPYRVNGHAHQLLSATYTAGARYTVSVWVNRRIASSSGRGNAGVFLYREDQAISPDNSSSPVSSTSGWLDGAIFESTATWQQLTFTYVATSADAGQRIGIAMGSAFSGQPLFDDVTITEELPNVVAAQAIPTLGEWGMIIMFCALGLAMFVAQRGKDSAYGNT